jgi:hypothetical protein
VADQFPGPHKNGPHPSGRILKTESKVMSKKKNLAGLFFGKIEIIKEADPCFVGTKRDRRTRWLCRCVCGKEWLVRTSNLTAGNIVSCGCISRTKHGLHKSPEYSAWRDMIKRCTNPNCKVFKHYGGRGISVCDSWQKFENFYRDMGSRPSGSHTLDRIDNEKGYEPCNCRWATMLVQSRNTRRCVRILYAGREMALSEAISMSGLKESTVRGRISSGWPEDSWFLPCGSKRPLLPSEQ